MGSSPELSRQFLRHAIATLAYRGGKALREAPPGFGEFRASDSTRTPAEILAHLADLLDWALSLADGKSQARNSSPLPWKDGVDRFFRALEKFDDYLASEHPLQSPAEKLFQGPVADSLTHVGQLAILRRMAGVPVRGENYFQADIQTGRVGPEQSPPRREFD